jgi:alpha-L-fucosidase
VLDFEKAGRGPKTILPGGAWQIDDQIATNSWGYINDIKYRSTASVLTELVDTASKGGNLLLNISPRADGTIPDEQQQILRSVGKWLEVNGEAIYGSLPWTPFEEASPPPAAGGRAVSYRFTTRNDALYAIALGWPGRQAILTALGAGQAGGRKVKTVRLLGVPENLAFAQAADALRIDLPATPPGEIAYTLKIDLA